MIQQEKIVVSNGRERKKEVNLEYVLEVHFWWLRSVGIREREESKVCGLSNGVNSGILLT